MINRAIAQRLLKPLCNAPSERQHLTSIRPSLAGSEVLSTSSVAHQRPLTNTATTGERAERGDSVHTATGALVAGSAARGHGRRAQGGGRVGEAGVLSRAEAFRQHGPGHRVTPLPWRGLHRCLHRWPVVGPPTRSILGLRGQKLHAETDKFAGRE